MPQPAADRLLFTPAKNGNFSAKRGYQLLKADEGEALDKILWDGIWKNNALTSKLKIFLWRCIRNALPVSAVIAARIHSVPSICKLCSREYETVAHMLFHCDGARTTWLQSPLSLRSGELTGSVREIIQEALSHLDQQQVCHFVCTMWACWRGRNDVVMGMKAYSAHVCQQYYLTEYKNCNLRMLVAQGVSGVRRRIESESTVISQGALTTETKCLVDGSWSEGGNAGIGVTLLNEGQLYRWTSKHIQAVSPAKAEAVAVLEGLRMLQTWSNGQGVVMSDSMETVQALTKGKPEITDWRSYEQVWNAWFLLANSNGRLRVLYCSREEQEMGLPHALANLGRLQLWKKSGCTEPDLLRL